MGINTKSTKYRSRIECYKSHTDNAPHRSVCHSLGNVTSMPDLGVVDSIVTERQAWLMLPLAHTLPRPHTWTTCINVRSANPLHAMDVCRVANLIPLEFTTQKLTLYFRLITTVNLDQFIRCETLKITMPTTVKYKHLSLMYIHLVYSLCCQLIYNNCSATCIIHVYSSIDNTLIAMKAAQWISLAPTPQSCKSFIPKC